VDNVDKGDKVNKVDKVEVEGEVEGEGEEETEGAEETKSGDDDPPPLPGLGIHPDLCPPSLDPRLGVAFSPPGSRSRSQAHHNATGTAPLVRAVPVFALAMCECDPDSK
jgi:hypothetical protein